ncbi:hypothetical protein U1Q18_001652 [Sarracenia purpurea var. burkii]
MNSMICGKLVGGNQEGFTLPKANESAGDSPMDLDAFSDQELDAQLDSLRNKFTSVGKENALNEEPCSLERQVVSSNHFAGSVNEALKLYEQHSVRDMFEEFGDALSSAGFGEVNMHIWSVVLSARLHDIFWHSFLSCCGVWVYFCIFRVFARLLLGFLQLLVCLAAVWLSEVCSSLLACWRSCCSLIRFPAATCGRVFFVLLLFLCWCALSFIAAWFLDFVFLVFVYGCIGFLYLC